MSATDGPPAAPRLLLIVNPRSGRGRGEVVGERAATALRDAGAHVQSIVAETTLHARGLVGAALSESWHGAVVVGGDGTLAGVVDLLLDARMPVTLVAAGTGDDLARELGVADADPARAALAALTGSPQSIDLGTVRSSGRTTVFLTVAAMGFDAKVSERTNQLRWPSGRLRYHRALLIELLRLRPSLFQVAYNGSEPISAPGTLLAVGNTQSYGGGMPMCLGARTDDGLLDAVLVAPLRPLRLLRLFPLLLRGRHLTRSEVHRVRCTSVRVSAPDLVIYADGERVGHRECEIGILPAALTMMVPSA